MSYQVHLIANLLPSILPAPALNPRCDVLFPIPLPILLTPHTHTEGQLLKLPANKFTVREREMLIGSGILPREFFEATQNPFVIGIGACEWTGPWDGAAVSTQEWARGRCS
jgi:hypothetical protein